MACVLLEIWRVSQQERHKTIGWHMSEATACCHWEHSRFRGWRRCSGGSKNAAQTVPRVHGAAADVESVGGLQLHCCVGHGTRQTWRQHVHGCCCGSWASDWLAWPVKALRTRLSEKSVT